MNAFHNSFSFHTEGMPPGNTYQSVCNLKSTEVNCISNPKELLCIFQKDRNENDKPQIPTSGLPPMWLIHIHNFVSESYDTSNNVVTTNSSSYCQVSDPDDVCTMNAVYSQTIFDAYPAALLTCLTPILEYFNRFQFWLSMSITETSWTVPLPFCSGHFETGDFVQEVNDLIIVAV